MTTYGTATYGASGGTYGSLATPAPPAPGDPIVPTMTFEVAFAYGARSSAPSYTTLPSVRQFGVRTGKQNALGRVEAGTLDAIIDNRNRNLDALNVASPYYARKGNFPGTALAYATDNADTNTDITGDITVAALISPANWTPSAEQVIVGKRGTTSGWSLNMATTASTGRLRFRWFTAATTSLNVMSGTISNFYPNGSAHWVMFTMDVSFNGVRKTTFWISDSTSPHFEDVEWEHLSEPAATEVPTSIGATTALMRVGANHTSGTEVFTGHIHSVYVAAGLPETALSVRADPKFIIGALASTSVTDSLGNVFTFNAGAGLVSDTTIGSWVRPIRRMRVRAAWDGTTYTVFDGFVESWPMSWPGGPYDDGKGDAVVAIKAADAFKLFAQTKFTSYSGLVRSYDPVAYWRFNETELEFKTNGAIVLPPADGDESNHYAFLDEIGDHHLELQLDKVFGDMPYRFEQPSLVNSQADTSVLFGIFDRFGGYDGDRLTVVPESGTRDQVVVSSHDTPPAVNLRQSWLPQDQDAFTICGWIQPDMRPVNSANQDIGMIVYIFGGKEDGAPSSTGGLRGGEIMVYLNYQLERLIFRVRDAGGTASVPGPLTVYAESAAIFDPNTLHPAPVFFSVGRYVTPTGLTFAFMYINGVLVDFGSTANPARMSCSSMTVGDIYGLNTEANLTSFSTTQYHGTLDELAIFDYGLTQQQVKNLYDVGVADLGSDSLPGGRIGALLDLYKWPAANRSIDAGEADLSSHRYEENLLAAMQGVASAEDGEVYMEPGTGVKFQDRLHFRNTGLALINSSPVVFGDQGTETRYFDLEVTNDDDDILNEARISREGGSGSSGTSNAESLARNVDSIVEFGVHDYSRSAPLATRSDATNLAQEIVRRNAQPRVRLKRLSIKPSLAPTTMWDIALGLKLFDKVTVKRTPPGGGARIDVECFIIGIDHGADAGSLTTWVTTFDLVEASVYQDGMFELNSGDASKSIGYGVIGY